MRIGFDARYLSHGLAGGVHTYVGELVRALVALETSHELVLYADRKRPFELSTLPPRVRVELLPWQSLWSTLRNDLTISRAMAHDGVHVAHFPANYGIGARTGATVLTLHDTLNLMPLRRTLLSKGSPQTVRSRATSAYLWWWTTRSVRRATLVLTVSEYSRTAILEASGLRPDRVVAIPHGAPPGARPITSPEVTEGVRNALGVHGAFVLADALKNPEVLLRAWSRLPADLRAHRTIVFYARHRHLFPAVRSACAAGTAQLVVRPSRDQLAALYSMADAFVFPSWLEGFGLPALEAMAYGTPLICSNRGALPEVVGEAARLVEPDDDASLARELSDVLGAPSVAAELRARGFARAEQFSWRRTAERVLGCYLRAREALT